MMYSKREFENVNSSEYENLPELAKKYPQIDNVFVKLP